MVIALVLWMILSLLMAFQCAPAAKDLPTGDKLIIGIICIIGGPIVAAANIIEMLLDFILPEGWNDDDSTKY